MGYREKSGYEKEIQRYMKAFDKIDYVIVDF